MPFEIKGPTRQDGATRTVNVSPDNRLMVASKSNVRGFYVSRDDARLFNVQFIDASAAAGEYPAYLKNTSSTRIMAVDICRLGTVNAATFKIVTATGTATGGSAVTAVNMNRQSGITPEASMLQDNVGGFTPGTALIAQVRVAAATSRDIPFDDTLILGPGNAIAVEYDAGTTGACDVMFRFFFEDIIA